MVHLLTFVKKCLLLNFLNLNDNQLIVASLEKVELIDILETSLFTFLPPKLVNEFERMSVNILTNKLVGQNVYKCWLHFHM